MPRGNPLEYLSANLASKAPRRRATGAGLEQGALSASLPQQASLLPRDGGGPPPVIRGGPSGGTTVPRRNPRQQRMPGAVFSVDGPGLGGEAEARGRERGEEAAELDLESRRMGVEGQRLDLRGQTEALRRLSDPRNRRPVSPRGLVGPAGPRALREGVGEGETGRPLIDPTSLYDQQRADVQMGRQRESAERAEDLAGQEREFAEGGRRFDVGEAGRTREFSEGQRQFNVGEAGRQRGFAEDVRRFDLLRGDITGAGAGGTIEEERAAEAAAFGRAKEQTGDITQGALTALTDELGGRGFGTAGGGGGEASARSNVISSGARDLSEVSREQAVQGLARRDRLAAQRQAGLRALIGRR